MSFIDKDTVKAFMKENSWLTVSPEDDPIDDGTNEIFTQIDSIIFNKTGVVVPDPPNNDIPILKNIACSLFVYFTSGKQGELTTDERLRREKLYNDAMDYLNNVQNGNEIVYDINGEIVSDSPESPPAFFESTNRITGIV